MIIKSSDARNGMTVLRVLKNELKLSTKMITLLKKREDGILVDGKHVTVRHVLQAGEELEVHCEDRDSNENLITTEMNLDILYEDEDIIAVNKPPMLPTHPSHGHFDDTLANGVCFHVIKTQNTPFVFRAVNRLDRNTSGIVLIAKNRVASSALYLSMQSGKIEKKYIALLCGTPEEKSGIIETYIRRREKSIITREVCSALPDASYSKTVYDVLDTDGNISLVKAMPVTGRTHQLRVHFSHIGHSILGDDLYGSESDEISRQALHAYFLSFPHPKTGKIMTLVAEMPADMKCVAKSHGLS